MSARLQIGSLFSAYGVAGLFWGTFAAATPALQQASGLAPDRFGLALGAMTLAALPVMRGLGGVIHRIPALAIPLCLLAGAVGQILLAVAPAGPVFIAALMILGAGSGAADISLNLRTARIERDTGARLFNRTHALFPFAMLCAATLTGALREAGATPAHLFGGLSAITLAAAALEAHAGRAQRPEPPPEESRGLRLSTPVALLALIAAFAAFQEMASQSWAAIFVERGLSARPFLAGLAPAAFVLGLSAGRLGAHGIEARLPPMRLVRIAAGLATAGFLIVATGPPVPVVLAALFVAGMGVGPVEPAVFRAVATGPGGGRSLATVTMVAYLGYLSSPPVLGLLAGAAGWAAMWGATGVLALGVAALTVPAAQTRFGGS